MRFWLRQWSCFVLAGALYLALATGASAQVVVTVDGDTAYATISLTDNNGVTYDADVTIVFDTPQNLTPQALNLTATIADVNDVNRRLRGDGNANCLLGLLNCPTIDPDFPIVVTVEPIDFPWLFRDGFETTTDAFDGFNDLSFLNTYQMDIHTHDLSYVNNSPYRLYKAPVDGNFHDVTNDVLPGSVRVRGRGGAFSDFVVASDTRLPLTVSLQKILQLNARIVVAAISDGLRLDLLTLLAKVDTLILVDVVGALAALDELIDLIDLNAGTEIANVWSAHRDVVNDAGEMTELADTLRFSMVRLLGGTANP
ncbi:MAG TPA: DUF6689 family protein [Rhodanobacteraceae bacterium]|nr:DUF6689 family protein [Rhodanobacteraceae bacterium]